MSHTRKWEPICPQLRRVQEKARSNPNERGASLAHYLDVSALHRSFQRIRANSAPGVDGVSKQDYAKDLFANLDALHERLKSGKYRASPVLRRWTFGDGPGPGTFDFLGFTHISGQARRGNYLVRLKTSRKRFNRSLKAIGLWLKRHMHAPIVWQLEQLSLMLVGHYQYYGVRNNYDSLSRFREGVWKRWFRALLRRNRRPNVDRVYQHLTQRFVLPYPKITHREGFLPVDPGYLLGRAGCGNSARPDL